MFSWIIVLIFWRNELSKDDYYYTFNIDKVFIVNVQNYVSNRAEQNEYYQY